MLARNDTPRNSHPGGAQGEQRFLGGSGLVFGDGLRCAGGPSLRLETALADATGVARSSVPIAPSGGASPGDVKRYPLWSRDPIGSPCSGSFNLTNGLEVSWTN